MSAIRRAKDARAIRYGIQHARDVAAGRRRGRPLTPFGFRGAPPLPLWEQAYHREMSAMARDGRIHPPRGPSGAAERGSGDV